MHLANDDKLDEAVYQWLIQKQGEKCWLVDLFSVRKLYSCISGFMRKTGAPFQAGRGWLWQLCHRHKIRQLFFARRKGIL